MTVQYATYAPYPPTTTALGEDGSGTISNIACAGPCIATVYSAAGAALMSISSQQAINMPVSLTFSGGAPYVVQKTPSSITLSI